MIRGVGGRSEGGAGSGGPRTRKWHYYPDPGDNTNSVDLYDKRELNLYSRRIVVSGVKVTLFISA